MYNSLRFCRDNNGLREIRKKVYSRKTQTKNLEPYPKPWILPRESLKVTDHWVIP